MRRTAKAELRCTLLAPVLAVLAACGSSLPLPRTGPHLPDDLSVVVPYPPPPARAEVVPPPGADNLVWFDGEWQWRSRRWVWLAGRWDAMPPGSSYAPATTVRRADGALVWFAGALHAGDKK